MNKKYKMNFNKMKLNNNKNLKMIKTKIKKFKKI